MIIDDQTQPYDTASVVLRAQVFHNGHEHLVNTARTMARRVLILVGSAQEMGTARNPFDVETRMRLIRRIYPSPNVIIKPLMDLTTEDDINTAWGDHVLENMKRHLGKVPELIIYGKEPAREGWFSDEAIKGTSEIRVSRCLINIDATSQRKLMVENNREEWNKNHNQMIHCEFDKLRGKLLTIPYYKEMLKICG